MKQRPELYFQQATHCDTGHVVGLLRAGDNFANYIACAFLQQMLLYRKRQDWCKPVLRDHLFLAEWAVFQDRFYCIMCISLYNHVLCPDLACCSVAGME